MPDSPIVWALFPLLFVGAWAATGLLLSRVGGWHDLAEVYRAREKFSGETLHWRSAGMRYATRYNGCLTIGSNQFGLSLAILAPLRMGHPPLFFPWSDISVAREKMFFREYAALRFTRVSGVTLLLRSALAEKLLAHGPLRFEAA